jgi:hypothetical protein
MKMRTIKRNMIRGDLERRYGNHRVNDVMSYVFKNRQKNRRKKDGSN